RSERFRKQMKRVLAWAATAALVLVAVGTSLLSMTRSNDAKVARNNVAFLLQARPDAVPYAIKILEPLKDYAVRYLPLQFHDERHTREQRLHAACALAAFQLSDPEVVRFLAEMIPETDAAESRNIITALKEAREPAVDLLRRRWDGETDRAM